MGLFTRRKDSRAVDPAPTSALDTEPVGEAGESEAARTGEVSDQGPVDRSNGPFDRAEVDQVAGHLDLGSLLLLGVEGMELRLELDEQQTQVQSATAQIGGSSLQLMAFAAPRSGGLWAVIRDELAASVVAAGGTAAVVPGRYGPELHTRIPSVDGSGRTVFAPARFLGVDGPRWFLRGFLSGPAAIDEAAAAPLLAFFGQVIVVRGAEPMAPREFLALTMPTQPEEPAVAGVDGDSAEGADDGGEGGGEEPSPEAKARFSLDPFERGPEITEVR